MPLKGIFSVSVGPARCRRPRHGRPSPAAPRAACRGCKSSTEAAPSPQGSPRPGPASIAPRSPASPEPGSASGHRSGTARAGLSRRHKAEGVSEASKGSGPVLTRGSVPPEAPARRSSTAGSLRPGAGKGICPERSGKIVTSPGKSDQGCVDHTEGINKIKEGGKLVCIDVCIYIYII